MGAIKLDLIKRKLLAIARSGVFVNFPPQKIDETYQELKQLILATDSIEVAELYDLYELHVYLSLITRHDVEAKTYIDRITDQFGDEKSERIGVLKAMYLESQGHKKEMVELLSKNKDELRLSRRLLTIYREGNNNENYIKHLNLYLNLQPTDLIAWSELADEYKKIGHYDKAIFCLKEVLLQDPLAYPIFYKVGVLNYYLFLQCTKPDVAKKDKLLELVDYLVNARNNFLRAIEVCKDHKSSWLGVYIICHTKFVEKLDKFPNVREFETFKAESAKLASLSKAKVLQLNALTEEAEITNLKLQ